MQRICIVGPGRVGGALAIALSKAGYEIAGLVVRDKARLLPILGELSRSTVLIYESDVSEFSADIVLMTVPDTEIASAAERLSGRFDGSPVVIHTSGALDSNLLEPFRAIGSSV